MQIAEVGQLVFRELYISGQFVHRSHWDDRRVEGLLAWGAEVANRLQLLVHVPAVLALAQLRAFHTSAKARTVLLLTLCFLAIAAPLFVFHVGILHHRVASGLRFLHVEALLTVAVLAAKALLGETLAVQFQAPGFLA